MIITHHFVCIVTHNTLFGYLKRTCEGDVWRRQQILQPVISCALYSKVLT